ncbi:hypothetical protein GW17_00034258 [Ensete ventricosum]|nr:hypothetical protein GW17_00034258 [Ensete ventricosum]
MDRLGTLSTVVRGSASRPRGSTLTLLEPNTLSSESANSLRVQLCQVNQRLNEVQKEIIKSKEELGESSKGGSPERIRVEFPLELPVKAHYRIAP